MTESPRSGRASSRTTTRRGPGVEGAILGIPSGHISGGSAKRLKRLQGRRVLICQNGSNGTQATRRFIGDQINEARFTFLDVPVREIFPDDPQPVVLQAPHRPSGCSATVLAGANLAVDGRNRVAGTTCFGQGRHIGRGRGQVIGIERRIGSRPRRRCIPPHWNRCLTAIRACRPASVLTCPHFLCQGL